MNNFEEYVPAPTDLQLENSPLITIGIEADVQLLEPSDWKTFSNRRTDPVPEAFREALNSSLKKLVGETEALGTLSIKTEDRPPRADPLFAQYFVDLSALLIQLVNDFGIEIASGVITSILFEVRSKMKHLVTGRAVDRVRIKESFTPAMLDLLCDNFVRIQRPEEEITEISHRPYNSRTEAGYTFPVNPKLPVGWMITVHLKKEQFEFTVDGNADIHNLEIIQDGNRFTMENASLKSPELAAQTLQRIGPWIGIADADTLS